VLGSGALAAALANVVFPGTASTNTIVQSNLTFGSAVI